MAARAAMPVVLGACALALLGGYGLKAQCLAPWEDFHQFSSLCYNDIQPLWSLREIADRTFPYVEGSLRGGAPAGGAIEYPVLTGVFMWASGSLATSADAYLVHSAALLAPFGIATAAMLARLRGLRALLFAAAPALVLYAFHNWDLLVVATAVGGFYAWARGRGIWAAVLFGIGGALKMYPLLFLAPLCLDAIFRGRRRDAAVLAGAGAGTWALINLPFALAGFEGWIATYEFHRLRGPNFDNIWALRDFGPVHLPALDPGALNIVTGTLSIAAFVAALGAGWVRARREGEFPVVAVSAALLAAFLLFNKVHSPQYTLWLLPFFVLLRVHLGWWIAYSLADLAVYVGVFRFFYDACSINDCRMFASPPASQQLMTAGVGVRALLLASLLVVFVRSTESPGPQEAPVVSHPPSKVGPVGETAARQPRRRL